MPTATVISIACGPSAGIDEILNAQRGINLALFAVIRARLRRSLEGRTAAISVDILSDICQEADIRAEALVCLLSWPVVTV